MAYGSLGGQPFLVDPESISYSFDIKASATETAGGKVVQVFGVKVSNLFVTGSFGLGGWKAQKEFLAGITLQMGAQRGSIIGPNGSFQEGGPINFSYPPRGWNFQVYVLAYTQPGGSMSVILDNTIINPKWTLEMFIENDNGQLDTVAQASLNSYLTRLSAGLGWYENLGLNIYNGPLPVPGNANSTDLAGAEVGAASPQAIANNGQVTQNGGGTIEANGYSY